MAGASLLTLLDDIATLLDDVAILTKVAGKKTLGVLGDDLALNAQQVSGVRANRELPIVWQVFKGSLLNKLILVPLALLISHFVPWLVTPLLIIGGVFLCFEGFEKVAHKFLHSSDEDQEHHRDMLEAVADPQVDMVAFEKDKIKGAVRTDFILSAEIIAIALGVVAEAEFSTRVAVLSVVGLGITVGVYGLVAMIVKLDDVGLWLTNRGDDQTAAALGRFIGRAILWVAPKLMKLLSILGTAAMFLVGGGILVHGVHWLEEQAHALEVWLPSLGAVGTWLLPLSSSLYSGLVGIVAGGITVAVVSLVRRMMPGQGAA